MKADTKKRIPFAKGNECYDQYVKDKGDNIFCPSCMIQIRLSKKAFFIWLTMVRHLNKKTGVFPYPSMDFLIKNVPLSAYRLKTGLKELVELKLLKLDEKNNRCFLFTPPNIEIPMEGEI